MTCCCFLTVVYYINRVSLDTHGYGVWWRRRHGHDLECSSTVENQHKPSVDVVRGLNSRFDFCFCLHLGGPRVTQCAWGLPEAWVFTSKGGFAIPGHPRALLWRWYRQPLLCSGWDYVAIKTERRMSDNGHNLIYAFSCWLSEKCLPWPKSADQPSKNPVVRSKSYNIPLLLTPVAEYDPDVGSSVGSGGIRRHSACEIISCLEDQGLAYTDLSSEPKLSAAPSNRLCVASQFNGMIHG